MEEGSVDTLKIYTKDSLVNAMTKPINTNKFEWCKSSYGLLDTLTT